MIPSSQPFVFLSGYWHYAGPNCYCLPQFTPMPNGFVYIGHREPWQRYIDV